MKTFRKLFIITIICIMPFSAFALEPYVLDSSLPNSSQNLNFYYKHPEPNIFPKIISGMIKYGVFSKAQDCQLQPLMTFFAYVLKDNPTHLAKYMGKIHFTKNIQRKYVYTILWESNTKEATDYLKQKLRSEDSSISKIVKTIMSQPPVNILQQKITTESLDQLWSAYFATGNPIFIRKIIEFINKDQTDLILGYEIVNRQFICDVIKKTKPQLKNQSSKDMCEHPMDDIFKAIKNKYPNDHAKRTMDIITVSSGIWSLGANKRQDKTVAKHINDITSSDKQLDYWRKIHKAIGVKTDSAGNKS
jgi:hypothetical protein